MKAGFIDAELWQKLRYGDTFENIAVANGVTLRRGMKGQLRKSTDIADLEALGIDTSALKPYYEHYLPLKGTVDIAAGDVLRKEPNKGVDKREESPAIVAAKGHENMVRDPLTQLFFDYTTAVHNEEQNIWKQMLLDVAFDHVSTKPVPRVSVTANPTYGDISAGVYKNMDGARRAAEEGLVKVWRDGQAYYISFADKSISDVFKKYDISKFVQGYNRAARFLATLYTTRNPMFIASNIARDFQSGLQYNIMQGAKQAKRYTFYWSQFGGDSINRIFELFRDTWKQLRDGKTPDTAAGRYIQEYFENGGPTAYNQMLSFNDLSDSYRDVLKALDKAKGDPDKFEKALKKAGGLVDWLERVGEMSELAARICTYCAARDGGKPIAKAIWESKEATVNFDKHGKAKYRQFFPLFANFQNAAIQACRREKQLWLNHKVAYPMLKAVVGVTKIGFSLGASYALYCMLTDDKELKGFDEFAKDYFRINTHTGSANIMLSWYGGSISFPVPLDDLWLHKACWLIGKRIFGGYREDETVGNDIAEVVSQVADMQGSNPIGSYLGTYPVTERDWSQAERLGWAFGFSNPLFSPIEQIVANTDFTGKPLVRDNENNLPRYKLDFHQSGWAHSVAEWLNTVTGGDAAHAGWINCSGADLTTLIKAYGGGPLEFGQRVMESGDIGIHWATGKPMDRYGEERQVGTYDFLSEFPMTNRYTKGGLDAYDKQEAKLTSMANRNRREKLEKAIKNIDKEIERENVTDKGEHLHKTLENVQAEINKYSSPLMALEWEAKNIIGYGVVRSAGEVC